MADFSHWELAETFTSREAAYLLMGVDPSGPDIDRYSARHIEERIERAYEGAIARAEFEGFVEPSFSFEDAPEPEQMPEHAVLRSNALWMQIEIFREHGDCSSFSTWLQYRGGRSVHAQVFSRFELARWLKENGMKSAYRFDLNQPDAVQDTPGRWPWGSHHTDLLGHLEAAARRFWVNYDPSDATTAPINITVSKWLQTERKVSLTMANSIASMLRPPDLPTGPRK